MDDYDHERKAHTPDERILSAWYRLLRAHREQEPGEPGRLIYEEAVLEALGVLRGDLTVQYAPPTVLTAAALRQFMGESDV